MSRETEKGVWKSVLGALGVASLFLTIFGNLAFTPKQSVLPRPMAVTTEHETIAQPAMVAERASAAEQFSAADHVPAAELASVVEPKPVTRPVLIAQVAAAIESAPVGDQVAMPEQVPEPEPVHFIQHGPALAITPDIESVPSASQISAVEPVTLAENRQGPGVATPSDNGAEHPSHVAASDEPPPVVPHKLSHHDRKTLRKISHLEKKMNRLVRDDRSIVCR